MVFILNSHWVWIVYQLLFSRDKISLCSNNEEMLAHCKQVFVWHANIVHFVNTLDFVTLSEYLTLIWGCSIIPI